MADVLDPWLSMAEAVIRTEKCMTGLRYLLMIKIDAVLSRQDSEGVSQAKIVLEELRDTVDKIRANYWQW